MPPARDVAIGVWLHGLLPAGQADWSYIACFINVFTKFHKADIKVHHSPVIAGMQNNSLNPASLHEVRGMIQVVDAKHNFPYCRVFSPWEEKKKRNKEVKLWCS